MTQSAPTPENVTFDDYVAMSGAAKAMGMDAMLRHYGLDMARWAQIAGRWNSTIPTDLPRYGQFGILVEQEGARIAAGGAPRPLGAPAPAPPPAGPPQAGGYIATPYTATPAGYPPPPGQPYPQPSLDQQAQHAAGAIGSAAVAGFNVLGSALGAVGKELAGIAVGSLVLVTWSDGQRYPGTVQQIGAGQYLVRMTNGQQHWIPQAYVARS